MIRDQAIPTTTILTSTTRQTSTTVASNPMIPSCTTTPRPKCGPANSSVLPSTHFRFDTRRSFSYSATAWQQRRKRFARRLQITRMTSSPWESMDYAWTRRSVCLNLSRIELYRIHWLFQISIPMTSPISCKVWKTDRLSLRR